MCVKRKEDKDDVSRQPKKLCSMDLYLCYDQTFYVELHILVQHYTTLSEKNQFLNYIMYLENDRKYSSTSACIQKYLFLYN